MSDSEFVSFVKGLSDWMDLPFSNADMVGAEILLMAIAISAGLGILFKGPPVLFTFIAKIATVFYTKLNRAERSEKARRIRGGITFIIFMSAAFFLTGFLLRLIPTDTALPLHLWAEAFIIGASLGTSGIWFASRKALDVLDDPVTRRSQSQFLKALSKDDLHTDHHDMHELARKVMHFQAIALMRYLIMPAIIYGFFGLPALVMLVTLNALDYACAYKSEHARAFAKPIALIDGVLYFILARLTLFVMYLASILVPYASNKKIGQALNNRAQTKHKSNASLVLSAFAGAMNVTLGGPSTQEGTSTNMPWLGPDESSARVSLKDIARGSGFHLYCTVCVVLFWFAFIFAF